eukprot:CAMPEP_0172845056 /NCGR_PEP_ID=MMETSP1075-20121228/32667_1 /TAXON_ID=2916 /ORGANISM="Ceratium fusus, Strain PA161109" /LENGTH=102 /DNA_ID=CAMNT_0013689613 /DNA_START=185 /DNA_END=494 /DNA_ORIENTATION=+
MGPVIARPHVLARSVCIEVPKRVEGCSRWVVAVVPPLGSPAAARTEQSQSIDALDLQHFAQALVRKEVLTPHASSTTELTKVASASAPARSKGLHSSARQNL